MKHDVHESAALHVSGEALYTHDLALRDARALHAWPVQSKHAHARIRTSRRAARSRFPGVHLCSRRVTCPASTTPACASRRALFPEEIMYMGQPVAWVVAETEDVARAGRGC